MSKSLSTMWDVFRLLQGAAYNPTNSSRAYGREVALDVVLHDLTTGGIEPEVAPRRFTTVAANRYRVDRARVARATRERRAQYQPRAADAELDLARRVDEARAEIPRDWDLLIALGMGHSIAEVANANGIKPGTIKARVSRARARLRMLHGPSTGSARALGQAPIARR